MDKLCDDTLSLILKHIHDPEDRKSFSMVNKSFLKIEGLHRSYLQVLQPCLLFEWLPRFPNLLYFEVSKPISDTQIEFVAKTCPRIQVFNLSLTSKLTNNELDIGVDGICAIAQGCCELWGVSLRSRSRVGDYGVVSLLNSASNLTTLDLGRCNLATEFALKAIGNSKSIISLNLEGCSWVTNRGLAWLAKGPVSKILKTLVIAECDQITNIGVSLLHSMCCLEALDISDCGPDVTDIGCVEITKIRTLKELNLAWVDDITDVTIDAISQSCLELEALNLSGCDLTTEVTVKDLWLNHQSLKSLVLPCGYQYCKTCVADCECG